MTEQPTTWLTQDAFDRLTEELAYLKTDGRRLVSAKIAQAREEGDLSENGGYHAAREEQGHQEARIRQLTAMLENAQVGEAPADSDEVTPGVAVTIYYDDDPDDTDTFLLGSRELMGLDESVDIEVYSPQSPLGAAILGHKVGETVTYRAPAGHLIEVTVVEVKPFTA
ncbi:MAG TPA: transcription elongation factor GreA [Propionicimonas sp.]|nr:transcription elongation factor GreA [Propionicimonas sp.]HQA77826.1 transcription elongation factor GreA [Propionicimonas sp.]HQD96777.1 transcription elongation factor GreA [Propionicimonas sp.]